jgi:aryl-alcohol dehydrogenase-like predicted oxidoreductase
MEYRNLGQSGLQISVVGVGCMTFGMSIGEQESAAIVHRALDVGVNFFDTADVYGDRGKSETWLGTALGGRRHEAIVATKFGGPMSASRADMQGGSRRYLISAVESSLARLGTDYIDLYQMHLPDPRTPLQETLRALDDLVRQGKVRYVGCSNYAAWQLVDAHWLAKCDHLAGFVSAQNRYSLLTRDIEKELIPAARRCGVGILPYFPLESGLLTGKYRRGAAMPVGSRLAKWGGWGTQAFASDEKFALVERLEEVCRRHDVHLLDLAIGWLVSQPQVSCVIAGVTSVAQLEANIAAAAKVIPAEVLAEASAITAPPAAAAGPQRRSP